jgi:hypothetical protein
VNENFDWDAEELTLSTKWIGSWLYIRPWAKNDIVNMLLLLMIN